MITYLLWMGTYLGTLGAIVIYEIIKFQLQESFFDLLKSPELYCELVVEVCIANVILSDILYANLF